MKSLLVMSAEHSEQMLF